MTGELIAHLWQSTLFASMVGLLTIAFRKNRANVRFWLWLSGSLKFFIPFALLMSFGSRLDWTPAAQRMIAQRLAAPEVSLAVERVTEPFSGALQFTPPARGAFNWTPIVLFSVWVCGFVAITLLRLRSWRRIRAAVRMSAPLETSAAVQVRSSPGLLEPGVVGFLRPVLLLPEGIMDRLTPLQLETVIAHELCHIRRRDNFFASIHMVAEAVFWFHPMVWWIGARMVEERERACDEDVLSMGNEPRIYADAILNVCKLYVESPIACVSGVTGANLKRRIEAIMTNRTGQGLNRAKKLLLASAGIAALAGPVAVGIVIGVGNAPTAHAQPPSAAVTPAEQPAEAAPAPVSPLSPAPQQSAAPAPAAADLNRRQLALLFDFDTMTPDDEARARQSATDFIRNRTTPSDLVAVIGVSHGELKVALDFTGDYAIVESTLLKIGGGEGNSPAGGIAHRLSTIETAAHLLSAIPGKKALIYFASGIELPGADDQAELRRAMDAAIGSNVAIYTIDVRGLAGSSSPQSGTPGAPAEPQAAAEPQTVVEGSVRIDRSPPLARYWSRRGADATLEDLPGGHFFVLVHAAGEYQEILVPIGEYRGQVQISGQIKSLRNTAQAGIGFGRLVQSSSGTYEASVILGPGSYVCSVLVKEQATGQTYEETVTFEVK